MFGFEILFEGVLQMIRQDKWLVVTIFLWEEILESSGNERDDDYLV